ncbi:hypothetical protein SRABI27_00413 [Pedobacter sp. Bi27]|uniref:hypothetical protein n=1 Tax=unclassified Pedobacter TaxID=2628915 RepID=UPI001DEDD17C|nr:MULTISPECIES: hypothetical protein [unclassified Pedobacter]CAH0146097.1 hypothetical protein SRABI126_00418 [Pedobacter sp. Bi126]CAH0146530.1 hypothetical protein SRABI27_00413 [Pedobacter sp. Bi27]CAH0212260.1 hypothetical protein SRABI36_02263 [Pedobacter sp. Bi36]
MKRTLFILTSIVLIISLMWACKDREDSMRNVDSSELDRLYKDIEKSAQQFTCENAGEWKFTAIGSKACGGASGYIAYSVKIDESTFLKKVEQFTKLQADYNQKYGVYSDCALVIQPKGVTCDNGKPKFTY